MHMVANLFFRASILNHLECPSDMVVAIAEPETFDIESVTTGVLFFLLQANSLSVAAIPHFTRCLSDLHIPDMRFYILERVQCVETIISLTGDVQHAAGELFFIKDGNIAGCKWSLLPCEKLQAAARRFLAVE